MQNFGRQMRCIIMGDVQMANKLLQFFNHSQCSLVLVYTYSFWWMNHSGKNPWNKDYYVLLL